MPDITLPEVRLKDKLPEGLRDMTMDDIQKAIPDVRLPRIDLGREARGAARAAEKAATRAAKEADKATRRAQKSAAKEAARAARAVEKALPRSRSGPNVVPVAILAMIGGAVVGWILANNPSTGPRISAWLDDLRMRFDEWRNGAASDDDEWDADAQAFTTSLRTTTEPDAYAGNLPPAETGVGVGPGHLPEGMGTSDPTAVGADERL